MERHSDCQGLTKIGFCQHGTVPEYFALHLWWEMADFEHQGSKTALSLMQSLQNYYCKILDCSTTRFGLNRGKNNTFKDAYKYSLFLPKLQAYFDEHFPDVKVEFTGMMMLLVQVFSNSIHTTVIPAGSVHNDDCEHRDRAGSG